MIKNTLVASVTIIIWLVISFTASLSLLELTNLSFLVGIVCLVICTIVYIIQSNFLTLFIHGFKKAQYVVFPQSRSSQRAEILIGEDSGLAEWKASIQNFFKQFAATIGVSTLVVSLVSLVMYY